MNPWLHVRRVLVGLGVVLFQLGFAWLVITISGMNKWLFITVLPVGLVLDVYITGALVAWNKERLEAIVDKLTAAITDLTTAIANLQTRTNGMVLVAQVEAAAAQIEAAVTTLNGIAPTS
jgi:hypothetical protein